MSNTQKKIDILTAAAALAAALATLTEKIVDAIKEIKDDDGKGGDTDG